MLKKIAVFVLQRLGNTLGAHKPHNKLDHSGALTIRTMWVAQRLTGLTSFIFMLDRYLKICRALVHNFTPSVIITAVTRDGSFEPGWSLKRAALETRRVIPGPRVPLGKRIKEAPDNTLIGPD